MKEKQHVRKLLLELARSFKLLFVRQLLGKILVARKMEQNFARGTGDFMVVLPLSPHVSVNYFV